MSCHPCVSHISVTSYWYHIGVMPHWCHCTSPWWFMVSLVSHHVTLVSFHIGVTSHQTGVLPCHWCHIGVMSHWYHIGVTTSLVSCHVTSVTCYIGVMPHWCHLTSHWCFIVLLVSHHVSLVSCHTGECILMSQDNALNVPMPHDFPLNGLFR